MTIKDVAAHPSSIWVTILAAAGAILTGFSENKTAMQSIDSFCHQAENSSYQTLVDLREKVDWIHTRVQGNEKVLASLTTTPGGPSQAKPPAPTEEVEEPKEGEKPAEVAPAEKKEEQVVPLKKDGTIDWAPIERPAEQKAS